MNSFFEIQHSDGQVAQRVLVLSRRERELLESRGFFVIERTLDRTVYPFFLGKDGYE